MFFKDDSNKELVAAKHEIVLIRINSVTNDSMVSFDSDRGQASHCLWLTVLSGMKSQTYKMILSRSLKEYKNYLRKSEPCWFLFLSVPQEKYYAQYLKGTEPFKSNNVMLQSNYIHQVKDFLSISLSGSRWYLISSSIKCSNSVKSYRNHWQRCSMFRFYPSSTTMKPSF